MWLWGASDLGIEARAHTGGELTLTSTKYDPFLCSNPRLRHLGLNWHHLRYIRRILMHTFMKWLDQQKTESR